MSFVRSGWFISVLATVLLSVLGAGTGLMLAREQIRQMVWENLQEQAETQEWPFLDMLEEVEQTLPVLQKSDRACSEDQRLQLRRIAIVSRNLKDAGWLSNGQLLCSEIYGVKPEAIRLPDPWVVRADGLRIVHDPFQDRPPFDASRGRAYLFQRGDVYVVGIPRDLNRPRVGRTVEIETTMLDQASGKVRRPSTRDLIHPDAVLDRNWKGSLDNLLYRTECHPQEQLCTTAFEPFQAELAKNVHLQVINSTLGATVGVIVSLLGVLFFRRRATWPLQFHRAIRRGDIRMVYQPIVDMHSGRIVEVEALLRWKDANGEQPPPDLLIRLAERAGYLPELTELILLRVLSEMKPCVQVDAECRININITAADIENREFLNMVDRALKTVGIPSRNLCFEITEESTASTERVREVIAELRRRGIGIKIDDFGTGYSSLAYLRELQVDAIKIDKAFTQTIGTDAVTVVILPQILQIAAELNLRTIAEGIEKPIQESYYQEREAGILGQGWLYGRPMAAEDFRRLLEANLLTRSARLEPVIEEPASIETL